MVPVEQFNILEQRVGEIESTLVTMNTTLSNISRKMDRIEVGLFGDEKMGYVGVIEAQKLLRDHIKKLEQRIEEVEKVNKEQEISINAKRNFTDDVVVWGKRIFWIVLAGTAVIFLLTGKIGIGDILNLAK